MHWDGLGWFRGDREWTEWDLERDWAILGGTGMDWGHWDLFGGAL